MSSSSVLGRCVPSSIAGRLTAWFCASAFALVLLAAFVLYDAVRATVQWTEDQVLEQHLVEIRSLLQTSKPDTDMIAHEVSEAADGPRQVLIRVLTTVRDLVLETPDMEKRLPAARFHAPASGETPHYETIDENGFRFRALSVRVPLKAEGWPKDTVVQIAMDTTLDDMAVDRFRIVLVAVILVSGALCALVGWIIIRRQLSPLRRVIHATASIERATANERLDTAGLPTELALLGFEYNNMLDRLEGAYSRLRQYADNVAHELRSPVNRMLLNVEVALSKSRDEASYRDVLENTREDMLTMAQIVDTLLFLARAESDEIQLQMEPVRLAEEIADVHEFYLALAQEKGIELRIGTDPDPELVIVGHAMLLKRALSNLLSNALSHTPPGQFIDITAHRDGDSVVVAVADGGDGIEAEDLPYVFDRFFRGDRSRSSSERRLGLGLSITKSIVAMHHGLIAVVSTKGTGTRFSMTFPAYLRAHG